MISRWQLDQIERVIRCGGVIAYPTESVYGLGCDPCNLSALEKILNIKQRAAEKGLIILVSDISQAAAFIQPLSASQLELIQQPQTRATTWLIPRKPSLSSLLCGKHTKLAVRVTTHPIAKAICQYTQQALVSTSCNLQGKPEMKSVLEVRNKMGSQLDLVVNGRSGGQRPSQIIDLQSGAILRK